MGVRILYLLFPWVEIRERLTNWNGFVVLNVGLSAASKREQTSRSFVLGLRQELALLTKLCMNSKLLQFVIQSAGLP